MLIMSPELKKQKTMDHNSPPQGKKGGKMQKTKQNNERIRGDQILPFALSA